MRAQKALACTEDILNLRDCRAKIISSFENNDLPTAVKYLKQVHHIDKRALDSSEDYAVILLKEKEIKVSVQKAFQAAIEASQIDQVMLYCPLLQFLQLQDEARDNLLAFFREKIFISLSSEQILTTMEATDVTTAYLQALLHIFNTAFLIIQTYLPIVLQGLEESAGDVYFLRGLHAKVEEEARSILKKYIKYRNLNEFVSAFSSPQAPSAAEVHSIMDEVALLLQYCQRYSKYLKHVCHGAEARTRPCGPITVFTYPLDLDKMVDEVISKYYLAGENYLMRAAMMSYSSSGLDTLYFVLQKCSLRGIATNNIHACMAVMNGAQSMISGELLHSLNAALLVSVNKISSSLSDYYYNNYKKSLIDSSGNTSSSNNSNSNNLLPKSLFSLMAMNSSSPTGGANVDRKELDVAMVSSLLEIFNNLELAMSYTERLGRELMISGEDVFSSTMTASSSATTSEGVTGRHGSFSGGSGPSGSRHGKTLRESSVAGSNPFHVASEMDKLRASKESLDQARQAFQNALRQGAEKMVSGLQAIFKDLFALPTDSTRPGLYISFRESDARFDQQANLFLLPRVYIIPLENLLYILTCGLSEKVKDLVVGLAAECCCERLEAFIRQTSFSFSGAMKMEEIVRAVMATFTRYSSTSVRTRFARLKEVMQVLTSASLSDSLNENYTMLTAQEVEAVFALRVEH